MYVAHLQDTTYHIDDVIDSGQLQIHPPVSVCFFVHIAEGNAQNLGTMFQGVVVQQSRLYELLYRTGMLGRESFRERGQNNSIRMCNVSSSETITHNTTFLNNVHQRLNCVVLFARDHR